MLRLRCASTLKMEVCHWLSCLFECQGGWLQTVAIEIAVVMWKNVIQSFSWIIYLNLYLYLYIYIYIYIINRDSLLDA